MEHEKRLIDANAVKKEIWYGNSDPSGMRQYASGFIDNAPTIDAVVLPCKVGTQVWLTKWWSSWRLTWEKQSEPLPRNIHHFDICKNGVFAHFNDGCINIKYFGEIVFLTKEEAKMALAKMDGGITDEQS